MRRHLALAYQSLHESDVIRAALRDGRAALASWFEQRFGGAAFSFNGGRQALRTILGAAGLKPGDEVIICGFTCLAVPEAVLYAGLAPVYSDVAAGAWSSGRADVERVAGPRTRAVIIQHTFGIAHDLDAIVAVARERGWLVIEDCALALAGIAEGGAAGRSGDAAIFSFEMTKTVTSGWGGMGVVHDRGLAEQVRAAHASLPGLGALNVLREWLQVLLSTCLFRPQIFGYAKYLVAALYRSGLFRLSGRELQAREPAGFAHPLPRAHAALVVAQLARLEGIAAHARRVCALYRAWCERHGVRGPAAEGVTLLRFPLLIDDAARVVREMSLRGFELGRWFDAPVAPMPDPPARVAYRPGACPRAEAMSARIVNLPVNVRVTDADVVRLLAALDELGARPLAMPQ